mmetsp:Transcript_89235/g.247818  ORF Transcript_89235/g.247818 Transcript_89235/m.247818 type:complete len:240 (+) Transcript_89235:237-956(+)
MVRVKIAGAEGGRLPKLRFASGSEVIDTPFIQFIGWGGVLLPQCFWPGTGRSSGCARTTRLRRWSSTPRSCSRTWHAPFPRQCPGSSARAHLEENPTNPRACPRSRGRRCHSTRECCKSAGGRAARGRSTTSGRARTGNLPVPTPRSGAARQTPLLVAKPVASRAVAAEVGHAAEASLRRRVGCPGSGCPGARAATGPRLRCSRRLLMRSCRRATPGCSSCRRCCPAWCRYRSGPNRPD